jgi:hypothetical protein
VAAGKPFHVYIIKPMFPEGKPLDDSTLQIRRNEWMTAQYMVQAVAKELGDDWTSYLSFYFLANWSLATERVSKGSREERDSEIACGVWPGHGHDGDALKTIGDFRLGIWKAHFGPGIASAETPESPACVSFVRSVGDQNYMAFRTLAAPPNGHACRWPYTLGKSGLLAVAPGTNYRVFAALYG